MEASALGLLMVLGYAAAQRLFVRHPSPMLHPVFVSTCVALFALRACGLNVEADRPAQALALQLLGPVSIALVVPIYANRATLRAAGLPLLVGAVSGCLASIAAVISIAELAQLQATVLRALAVKSVTTPIAVELASLLGTDPALAASFVVLTALLGAMIGPTLLRRCRITDPVARGVALGSIAMGLGTAAALREDDLAGATAGVAMVVGALVTAIVVPEYVPALLHLVGA